MRKKDNIVWYQNSIEATLVKKPKYNGFIAGMAFMEILNIIETKRNVILKIL